MNHLPPYTQKYKEFKDKGVDVVAVLAANDPFVMSAWGRVSGFSDQVSQSYHYYLKIALLTDFSFFDPRSLPSLIPMPNGPSQLDLIKIFRE